MTKPVWEWLIRSQLDPYLANKAFSKKDVFPSEPRFSGTRLGQSTTRLADGREFLIGGEHEDHYDPDFFIYNDVIVKHPDGQIEIYGYPESTFPPTDFHSATSIERGSKIVILGSLGYPHERKPGTTQVLVLDTDSMQFSPVETTSAGPGWIHMHQARFAAGSASITIVGGIIDNARTLLENVNDWQLSLSDWTWTQLTDRKWTRVEVKRADDEMLHLWQISQIVLDQEMGESVEAKMRELQSEYGITPDLMLYKNLYVPAVDHARPPVSLEDDQWNVVKLEVAGVRVRIVEEMYSIMITVEGTLPHETVAAIATELRAKLAKLENSPCRLDWIEP